jgi:hypothetical protein
LKLRKDIIIAIAGLLLTANPCAAQPSPPEPTSGFCVNTVTGAIRDQLSNDSGFVRPCRINELGITLSSIAQLPVQPPSATFHVVRQLTETPVRLAAAPPVPTVVDATGKTLGNLIGFDYVGNAFVEMNLNTTDGGLLELPFTSVGFSPTQPFSEDDSNVIAYFTGSNCDSPAIFDVAQSPSGIQLVNDGYMDPVPSDTGNLQPMSTGIVGSTLFYGSDLTPMASFQSQMGFLNPANLTQITAKDGTFVDGTLGVAGALIGTPQILSLSAYTPPFSVQW